MVGQRLVEVVAEVPAHRKAVGRNAHQLPLGADVLKEHDQLQAKEDDRVDAGPAPTGIQRAHQLSDKGEVEGLLQATVEVILRDTRSSNETLCGSGEKTRSFVPITVLLCGLLREGTGGSLC